MMLTGEPDGPAIAAAIGQMLRQLSHYRGAVERLLAAYDRPHLAIPDVVREFCAGRISDDSA
jgi:hypothetical protein